MTQIDPHALDLPPGLHPGDMSVPLERLTHGDGPAPADSFHGTARGRKPWAQENDDALPVNQRSAHNWRAGLVVVNADNNGTAIVVGRQKGRTLVRLWVPTNVIINGAVIATPAGVVIGANENEVSAPEVTMACLLGVGDFPIELDTEASVYVGLVPGQAVGYCQYAVFMNPPGGGLAFD